MDAIGRGAEIEGAHAERVQRMAARHPVRQPRVLRAHRRGRRPGGVLALGGDAGHALPAALLAGDRDRVAQRLARLGDEVEPAITEAHHHLARGMPCGIEAHDLAAAAPEGIAAAPHPA